MQRNFDYITKKDLIIEHNGMNAEDKPEYTNYIEPPVTIPPPPFQKGSRILQFHSSIKLKKEICKFRFFDFL